MASGKPGAKETDQTGYNTPYEEEKQDDKESTNNRTGVAGATTGKMTGIVGDVVEQEADTVCYDARDKTCQKTQATLYSDLANNKTGEQADEQANEKS